MKKGSRKAGSVLRRIVSLLLSALLLLFCVPFMVLIAIAVRLDTAGPVFYYQERLGQGGRPFILYKFRTMYVDAEAIMEKYLRSSGEARREWETYKKLKTNAPRLTGVGRLLRRYSLDELPQVFNLLFGNIHLIGPRPYLPGEKEWMGKYGDVILSVKPGLTGLWQVRGRNRIAFQGRLELDAWYVGNRSLWLDMIILAKTPGAILKGEGA